MAKTRTNKEILYDVEKEVVRHGSMLCDLKLHFDNHIRHHEEREKETRKHIWALIIVAVGTSLTAISSLAVGLILIFVR